MGRRGCRLLAVVALAAPLVVATAQATAAPQPVAPPPTVDSMTRMSGPVAGGVLVGVHGTGLGTVTSARFGTATAAVQRVSATYLRFVAPAQQRAGTVDVRLVGPAGTSAVTIRDRFLVGGPDLSAQTLPVPSDAPDGGRDLLVGDVTCPAAGRCVAVGTVGFAFSHRLRPLVEVLSGGAWHSVPVPITVTYPNDAYLGDVACSTAGTCLALGATHPYGGQATPFALALSDGRWRVVDLDPAVDWSTLACAPTGGCVVAGTDKTSAPRYVFVTGGTAVPGRGVAVPDSGVPTSVSGVTCSSDTYCVAWGRMTTSAGLRSYAEVYDHGAVTAYGVPHVSPDGSGVIASVVCPADRTCVGYADDLSATAPGSLRLGLTDRGFTVASVPIVADPATPNVPAQGGAPIVGTSCASTTVCTGAAARGDAYTPPGVFYVDRLVDGSWISSGFRITPLVPFFGVAGACTADGRCVAPGYVASDGEELALLRLWGPSGFSTVTMPTPDGHAAARSDVTDCAPTGRYCVVIDSDTAPRTGDTRSWAVQVSG